MHTVICTRTFAPGHGRLDAFIGLDTPRKPAEILNPCEIRLENDGSFGLKSISRPSSAPSAKDCKSMKTSFRATRTVEGLILDSRHRSEPGLVWS